MKAKKPSYAALVREVARLNKLVEGITTVHYDDQRRHQQQLEEVKKKLDAARLDAGIKLVSQLGQSVEASARFQEAMARLAAGLTGSMGAF